MKVTKITVTFGGKVPAVQFGNVDVIVTREVELQDGDDVVQVTKDTLAAVKAAVIAEVEALPDNSGRSWLRAVRGVQEKPKTFADSLPDDEDDSIPY